MSLKIGTFQLLQALFNATKPFRNKTVTIVRLRTPLHNHRFQDQPLRLQHDFTEPKFLYSILYTNYLK